jgi:hypothetical protein
MDEGGSQVFVKLPGKVKNGLKMVPRSNYRFNDRRFLLRLHYQLAGHAKRALDHIFFAA